MSSNMKSTTNRGRGRNRNKMKMKLQQIDPPISRPMRDENSRRIVDICRDNLLNFLPLNHLDKHKKSQLGQSFPTDISVLLDEFVKRSLYEETLTAIRDDLAGHKLFLSLSTSCHGHCRDEPIEIINVAIGVLKRNTAVFPQPLKENEPGPVYLINSVPKKADTEEFYAKVLNESFKIIWPDAKQYKEALAEILFIVTEGEPECVEAVNKLKNEKQAKSALHPLTSVDIVLNKFVQERLKLDNRDICKLIDAIYVLIFEHIELGLMTRAEFCKKLSIRKPLPLVYNSHENFIEMAVYVKNNFDQFHSYCKQHPSTVAKELRGMFTDANRKKLTDFTEKYSFYEALLQLLQSRPIPPLSVSMQTIRSFYSHLIQYSEETLAQIMWDRLSNNNCFMLFDTLIERNFTGLFDFAPLVTQDRYRFPRYHFFKQMTEIIPAEHLYIHSVLYCYREECNFAQKNEEVYRRFDTFFDKFLSSHMISKKADHYNHDSIYSNMQIWDDDPPHLRLH